MTTTEAMTPASREAPPTPPVHGWRSWLPRVLVESVFIIFSVLVALAVDEWREARSNREQAAQAESAILEELRSNRALVDEALRYHSSLVDTLIAYARDARTPTVQTFPSGFVAPAQLSHTAWVSASETGALSHMDYHTVLRLSNLYAQQERYAEQGRSIGQLLYQEIYRGGTESIARNHRNLTGLIRTFVYREAQLIDSYDRTRSDHTLKAVD